MRPPQRRTRHSASKYAAFQIGNDQPDPNNAYAQPARASWTALNTQNTRSATYRRSRLKIIQVQVGHECDSSTAIYTHVSDHFMNTMLHKALAPVLDSAAWNDKER
jgi:hypothetical protein